MLLHEGYLRHLLVRKASRTGEILVALVTTSQEPRIHVEPPLGTVGNTEVYDAAARNNERNAVNADESNGVGASEAMAEQALLDGFRNQLLKLETEGRLQGKFAGILHIVNDSQADVVQSDRTDVLYGKEYFFEELLGLRFKISTFSFFQTNSHSAEVLYETAREYAGGLSKVSDASTGNSGLLDKGKDAGEKKRVIFDLYSGTGTIAQLMAPVAKKVIGVEIVEEAVEAARKNAAENGLDNCEFIAGDVLKVLDGIGEKPDLIILDPPRDGIHPKALPKIIGYGVEQKDTNSINPTNIFRK